MYVGGVFFSPKVKDRRSLVAHRRKFSEHCFLCECEKGCQPLGGGQEMMRINIVADSTGNIAKHHYQCVKYQFISLFLQPSEIHIPLRFLL